LDDRGGPEEYGAERFPRIRKDLMPLDEVDLKSN
jgi:hypothetical protein